MHPGTDSQEPKTERKAQKGPNQTALVGLSDHTALPAGLPSTCYRNLANRRLLQSSLSDFSCLKHCYCQSWSCGGRRQAAKEQLAVNYPLPNHLHLISGTRKAGTRPTSRGERMGGRTKPGFSRRHPKTGIGHSAEHPRAKAHPSLDAVAKITCISEREGEKKQDLDCCTVVSCLPVGWEGCMGHLTPGNSGSRADVTGFKTHQELKWSPILHLL